jgi:hypothetical protein
MSKETIVMYDSPEAASVQTVTGWVSRRGHFWRDDEHMARYDGSTHKRCECGEVHPHSSWCRACREKKMTEKFFALPVEKWDGETPLCLFDSDKYFFGDDILDYLAGLSESEEVRICKCKPGYLSLLSEDGWADDLPEDGELPDEVAKAVDALNEVIKAAGPVCWWEDAVAIDVADLRARIAR